MCDCLSMSNRPVGLNWRVAVVNVAAGLLAERLSGRRLVAQRLAAVVEVMVTSVVLARRVPAGGTRAAVAVIVALRLAGAGGRWLAVAINRTVPGLIGRWLLWRARRERAEHQRQGVGR